MGELGIMFTVAVAGMAPASLLGAKISDTLKNRSTMMLPGLLISAATLGLQPLCNLCNIKGTSPLCRASEQNLIGRKECVSILINSGAIDSPHSSAARGDVAALSQFLTNQAADINDTRH